MKPSDAFGWRNLVSGVAALVLGVFVPWFVMLVVANPERLDLFVSILVIVCAVALVIGLPLGILVEGAILPRFPNAGAGTAMVVYLVLGWMIDFALWMVFYWPSLTKPMDEFNRGLSASYFWSAVLIAGTSFTVVMVIARGIYPLIHRKFWRLEKD